MNINPILMIICDGLPDRPVPVLNDLTPLQHVYTPNMDLIARSGSCGCIHVIDRGIPPGSDTAHLALFGYDPLKIYTGRGPFEALGIGMDVRPGDVVFRCNFATVDDALIVKDRRAGRIKKGTTDLAKSLNMNIDDVEIIFKEGTEHRAALILRGKSLSPMVSDPDPHEIGVKVEMARPLEPGAAKTAKILNKFMENAHRILKEHPVNAERKERGLPEANFILPRGAGRMPSLKTLSDKYGLRCAYIAGVMLIKGICKVLGMEEIKVEGATGGIDADFNAKIMKALEVMSRYDITVVHIKAPDIASHDKNLELKCEIIKRIDESLSYIPEKLPSEGWLVLTADHTTPISVGEHTGDPVPLAISGPDMRRDNVNTYEEISAAKGLIGHIYGRNLLPMMLNYTNKLKKFGA